MDKVRNKVLVHYFTVTLDYNDFQPQKLDISKNTTFFCALIDVFILQ
jgi:hypothetical protein